MPDIQFVDVCKYYDNGRVKAIEDLNFTIYDGEYLSLLGPSGCGKTTTLRMVSGLILPTSGKIYWDGKPVQHLSASERDVGYIFQQFAIFPHINVWENIAFGAEVRGESTADIENVVEEYIKLVGLSTKAEQFPNSLEAADLQRVGIARILATGAKTLLLDEPMGSLDFKIREKFQDELVRLVKDLELTAIHVTHDQSEALAISDRIGVMKKGRMIQLGSPEDLLFNPSQIFTAHFIGEADFLEGIVTKVYTDHVDVELMGYEKLEVPRKQHLRINPIVGQRVILGIRREFFVLSYDDGKTGMNSFTGTVISDRFLGEKRRTLVKLEYERTIEVKRYPTEIPFNPGDKVKVSVPLNSIFLFNYPDVGLVETLEVT